MHPHFHLYIVCTRTHTCRAVSKHGKLNSKHRLWPIYLPVILLSLQTTPVTEKTNSNSQTSDETLFIFRSHSFCVGFHMYLDRHIFIWCNYCTHEEKAKKKKKDKRILSGRTGLNMHCLLSQWQPRTISAYGSLWGTWTFTTANVLFILGWLSNVYTKLFILFPAAVLNTKS